MRRKPLPEREVEVTVSTLGARGDGLAEWEGGRLFVDQGLAGERLRVRPGQAANEGRRAEIVEIVRPSPERCEPFCPIYGDCGGCGLQHLAPSALAAWKRERLVEALGRRGLGSIEVSPTLGTPAGQRRRVTFSLSPPPARAGFHRRREQGVVAVESCPLLAPELNRLIPPLNAALALVAEIDAKSQVRLTMSDSGADMALISRRRPGLRGTEALAGFAAEQGLASVSWQNDRGSPPEPLARIRPPQVVLAGVSVELPPGAFLQPSREGEKALVDLALEGLPPKAGLAVDLFAGLGLFSFAMAGKGWRVGAFEADASAVKSLQTAAGRAGLGGRIEAKARNLDRNPLSPAEMKGVELALFDPPRAGAAPQAAAIAAAPGISRVVAVSCNPSTLARDLRILVDAGFRAEKITPVDQFPFTPHVEAVALLAR